MGVVSDPYLFKGTSSVYIQDTLTAEEYVSQVFDRLEQLPSAMSMKVFLNTVFPTCPCEDNSLCTLKAQAWK